MDKVITVLVFGVIIIGVFLANLAMTTVQVNHCENDGGQAITRYFDLEYTGCIRDGE